MPRLSPEERERAIGHLKAGVSISQVARLFNVTRQTISSLQRRFVDTGSTRDHPGGGRPSRVKDFFDKQF